MTGSLAGRTDAGVHALGQVCHIDVTAEQLKRAGRSGLNPSRLQGLLPSEIVIHQVSLVSKDFDARFSATGRGYRYLIVDELAPKSPLSSRYELWVKSELDHILMAEAASELVGLRDFASFCKPRPGATTIRELRKLQVERNRDHIEIYLEADAFCHNQVRSIVGALIAVGEKRLSRADLAKILQEKKRSSRFKVVAPAGLALTHVDYPEPELWASQAEKAKNFRSSEEISV